MVIPGVDFGLKDVRAHISSRHGQILCQCDLQLLSGQLTQQEVWPVQCIFIYLIYLDLKSNT